MTEKAIIAKLRERFLGQIENYGTYKFGELRGTIPLARQDKQSGLRSIESSNSKSQWAHIGNSEDSPFVLKTKLRKYLALRSANSEGSRPA